ncbi:glycosyltransferase family 4 protein [bacterium]|nr:glycosyltransferase family 4 protein [bacterium]
MKIAIITPHIFNPSGIGSMCNNLASELIKKGNEVNIFSFDMLPQYRLNKVDRNAKIHIVKNRVMPSLNKERKRYNTKKVNWALDKYYHLLTLLEIFSIMASKLSSADLVHIHGYTDLTKIGFFVGKTLRKPIILNFHGTDVWYYKKSFFNLYRKIVRNVDKVICVSQCLADKLLKDTGVTAEVIPNMVSDFFILQRGKRSNLLKEKFNADKILLNVKGLIPISGHNLLIRSLQYVIKKYANLKLVLTGEGPLLKELKQLAIKLNLEKNVIFTGFKSHEVLVDFYTSADVYVLSSTLEARPNVVLESLLCETPVITTNNAGGIELASQHHEDITIIEEDTPVALAHAIIKMLEDGRGVKETTIVKISNELNTQVVTQRVCNTYRNVIDMKAKKYGT